MTPKLPRVVITKAAVTAAEIKICFVAHTHIQTNVVGGGVVWHRASRYTSGNHTRPNPGGGGLCTPK